jgi:hypothetical protein
MTEVDLHSVSVDGGRDKDPVFAAADGSRSR